MRVSARPVKNTTPLVEALRSASGVIKLESIEQLRTLPIECKTAKVKNDTYSRVDGTGGFAHKTAVVNYSKVAPDAVILKFATLIGSEIGPHSTVGENAAVVDAKIGASTIVENRAIIGKNCVVGDRVAVSKNTRLNINVKVGDGTIMFNADESRQIPIGAGTVIGKNVTMRDIVSIGQRSKIGDGAFLDRNLIIGNDVEIGTKVTVMESPISKPTVIGSNVRIGQETIIGGEANIAEGVQIGNRCTLGPKNRFGSEVTIDNDVITEVNVRVGPGWKIKQHATLKTDVNLIYKGTIFSGMTVEHGQEGNILKEVARPVPLREESHINHGPFPHNAHVRRMSMPSLGRERRLLS